MLVVRHGPWFIKPPVTVAFAPDIHYDQRPINGANREKDMPFVPDLNVGWRAWMMSQPCFFAVDMNERMTAKSAAEASQRNPPEIFCLTFIMRPSRSA